MATANTEAPLCEGGDKVRVGVVLAARPDYVVIDEEGCGVHCKSAKNEEAKSFSFDQVVTLDNIQSFHPEFLQPLTESISGGYNAALLICGASTEEINARIDQTIIKQLFADLFGRMLSQGDEEWFVSVSFVQFYPDGNAVDLLNPSRQLLERVVHPVLGSLVGGLCEVCVCSAEEACAVYETCREADAGSTLNRCSSLFSVAVERKLRPPEEEEEEEEEICRSRLQLFKLAGGASRTDLRGVSPLVKAVEQTQREDTAGDKILLFLLNDVLRGNSRTALIYCINPQGLLDDETPSALALAQKARSLVTVATVYRWCPRATERKIRDDMVDQRNAMMSQGESDVQYTMRLAELTQDLQVVKNQSWEKRREESKKIKGKRQSCRTNRNVDSSDARGGTDTMKHLQAQLKKEMEEHIREGKGDVEKVQERVGRIQQLRDALREETQKSGPATEKVDLCQQSQLEFSKAQEQRRRLKEDHWRLIQEEVETMERDLAQEQLPTEGPQRELLVLTRERRVLVLQIEALRAEAQQAERDLHDQYKNHQAELRCHREEGLEVFRVFRQVSEEQRRMSEGRYRSVVLEAVQDAVYLSAQNQDLQADNKNLRKALAALKDTLTVRGDPTAGLVPQQ